MSARPNLRGTWVAGLLLVGLLLQIGGIADRCLNTDEIYTAQLARSGNPGALLADVHPPLYPLLLGAVQRLGMPEIGWRLFSALLWLGAALGAYALGRRLAGERVGLVALALLVTSPQGILLGELVRSYALAACLGAWTYFLFARLFDEPTRKRIIGLAVLLALGCYTFYYFLYLAAALTLVALAWWKRRPPAASALLQAVLLSLFLFGPGLILLWLQASAGLGQGWETWSPAPWRVLRRVAQIVAAGGGIDGIEPAIRAVVPAMAGIAATAAAYFLFALGAWRLRASGEQAAAMPLVAVLLATIALALAAHFTLGSFIAIHYFALQSGGLAVVLAAPFGSSRRRWAINLALAAVLAANLYNVPSSWGEGREDLRGASYWIDHRLGEPGVVLGVAWFAVDGYRWYGNSHRSLAIPDDLQSPSAAMPVRARPGIATLKDMEKLPSRLANCREVALLLSHANWRGADRGEALVEETLRQAGFALMESWPPGGNSSAVRARVYRRTAPPPGGDESSCGFAP